jgi:hypothetical protein
MLDETWKLLGPVGRFFARSTSPTGTEELITPSSDEGRHLLPDGSERHLVNESTFVSTAERLSAVWPEPLITTNVLNQRCVIGWVLRDVAVVARN